jgi:hypothetical protein
MSEEQCPGRASACVTDWCCAIRLGDYGDCCDVLIVWCGGMEERRLADACKRLVVSVNMLVTAVMAFVNTDEEERT